MTVDEPSALTSSGLVTAALRWLHLVPCPCFKMCTTAYGSHVFRKHLGAKLSDISQATGETQPENRVALVLSYANNTMYTKAKPEWSVLRRAVMNGKDTVIDAQVRQCAVCFQAVYGLFVLLMNV